MHVASVIGQLNKPTSLSIHNVTATPPSAALVVPVYTVLLHASIQPNSALSISLDLHNTLYLHSLTLPHHTVRMWIIRVATAEQIGHLIWSPHASARLCRSAAQVPQRH